MKIGFIGLGAMGLPMARNLLVAGHEVVVFNRTKSRAEELRPSGAVVAGSLAQACETETVITMLADDGAVEDLLFASPEFFSKLPLGGIHVSMSTISIPLSQKFTQRHEQHGSTFVAAPVFGRPDAAASRNLIVVAAGLAEAIEKVRPVFESLSRKVVPVSPTPFHANLIKVCGNFILLSGIATLAESLAVIRTQSVSPTTFLDVMGQSLFTAPFYQGYGARMAAENFEPAGFKLALGSKDVSLFTSLARDAGLSLTGAKALEDAFAAALAQGLGGQDVSALARAAGGR